MMEWKYNKKENPRGCTRSPRFQFQERKFGNVKCENKELKTITP